MKETSELILKCFCESRKTQAFFSKCLSENLSETERSFIIELIKDSSNLSEKISNYCKG